MAFIRVHDTYNSDSDNLNVFIECPKRGIFVEAHLAEDLSLDVESKWDSFFGNLEGNGIISFADTVLQIFKGTSIQNPILKRKIWKGSDPMSIPLNLVFYSTDNAENKVLRPAEALMKLALPVINKDNTVQIPGPAPVLDDNGEDKGNPVNLYIGKWLSLKSVYVRKVSVKFSQITQNSYPIKASVSVDIGLVDAASSNNLFNGTALALSVSNLKSTWYGFVKAGS